MFIPISDGKRDDNIAASVRRETAGIADAELRSPGDSFQLPGVKRQISRDNDDNRALVFRTVAFSRQQLADIPALYSQILIASALKVGINQHAERIRFPRDFNNAGRGADASLKPQATHPRPGADGSLFKVAPRRFERL